MTWQVGKIADSIDRLTSYENLYLFVTLVEMYTGREILPGTPNDVGTIFNSWRNLFVDVDAEGNPIESTRGTWEGFWDVDLQKDWARFMAWLRGENGGENGEES